MMNDDNDMVTIDEMHYDNDVLEFFGLIHSGTSAALSAV